MDQSTLQLLGIVGLVVGLVSLVCWILTLVKMFQNDKVLIGILGILCPLWAFVWGWMNADRTNHKNVMIAWSVAIVINILINVFITMNAPNLQGGLPGAPVVPAVPGLIVGLPN